jgi:hypothetical protein
MPVRAVTFRSYSISFFGSKHESVLMAHGPEVTEENPRIAAILLGVCVFRV